MSPIPQREKNDNDPFLRRSDVHFMVLTLVEMAIFCDIFYSILGSSFEADDDHLLHEVEQELRGSSARSKPAERACQTETSKHVLGNFVEYLRFPTFTFLHVEKNSNN